MSIPLGVGLLPERTNLARLQRFEQLKWHPVICPPSLTTLSNVVMFATGCEVNHDIVVVGTSAGGVNALQTLCSGLPKDLPSSVFITIHTGPDAPGYLAEILARMCPLPVVYAGLREEIQTGKVYLARSNLHLIVKRGQVISRFLAKENGTRPAIDPMFRSAAQSYGRRVIGVVLTGNLDDGTAGLGIIKDEGGIAIVQDPNDAVFNSMPLNAIKFVKVDHVVPLSDMAPLLVDLVRREVKSEGLPESPVTEQSERLFTCPGCGGPMHEYLNHNALWYKCQVGHRFTPEAMMEKQNDDIEERMWNLLALLRQKAELNRTMASDARCSREGTPVHPDYFETQAREAQKAAATMEALLEERGQTLFPGPPEKTASKLEEMRRERNERPESRA